MTAYKEQKMRKCRLNIEDEQIAVMVASLAKIREKCAAKTTIGQRMTIPQSGKLPIEVILHRPSRIVEHKLPVLFNMHGGAWLAGDAVMMENFCQLMSDQLPAMVVNVNYHKADIISIPKMIEEVVNCVSYFMEYEEDYGIDIERMVVGGHSAGANLAAGAAIKLKEEGISLCAQMLVYPCTDLSSQTIGENELTPLFHTICTEGEEKDYHISQLLSPDEKLKGLCPTLFVECGLDILRPLGIAYAKRLLDNAVSIKVKEYPKALHGFLEVCQPDYGFADERNTEEQRKYARDCEMWLIRELKACMKEEFR